MISCVEFKVKIGYDNWEGKWTEEEIKGIAFGNDIGEAVRNIYKTYQDDETYILELVCYDHQANAPVWEFGDIDGHWDTTAAEWEETNG